MLIYMSTSNIVEIFTFIELCIIKCAGHFQFILSVTVGRGGALYKQCFKHPPFQHSDYVRISLKLCIMNVEINELN